MLVLYTKDSVMCISACVECVNAAIYIYITTALMLTCEFLHALSIAGSLEVGWLKKLPIQALLDPPKPQPPDPVSAELIVILKKSLQLY